MFTAAFLPVQDPATGEVQGPADGGPGPSSHGPAPDQGPDGGPSGDFGPAFDAPPSPDAGTGSSCSSSPADPPTHYHVAVGGGACTEEAQLGTLTRRPGGSAALGSMWGSAHASQQVLPEDKQARTSVAQAPSCRAGTVCSLCRLHGSVAILPPRLVGFTIHSFCVAFCLPAAGFARRLVAWVAPLAARWLQRPLVVYCVLVQFATSTEGMQLAIAGAASPSRGQPLSEGLSVHPLCADGPPMSNRPLPTPLRSLIKLGRLPPLPDTGSVLGDLDVVDGQQKPFEHGGLFVFETLLEESNRVSNGYPFYLAATLLETLADHFADGASTSSGERDSIGARPIVLSLDSVVPSTLCNLPPVPPTPLQLGTLICRLYTSTEPLVLGGAPLGFTSEQIALFLQPAVCFGTLSDLLAALPTRQAHSLRASVPAPGNERGLLCYVDGSYTPARHSEGALLGWACIFIDVTLLCISVVSGPAPPWFPDLSVAPSAFVAECLALTAAIWVGCTAFHGQTLHFLSDCQSAIQVAAGEVSSYTNDVALVLRRTAACFEVLQRSPLAFNYVPGHQGHFGNEAADAAAKLASRGCPVGQLTWQETGGSSPFDWWTAGAPRVEWCGVAARALTGDTTMPPLGGTLDGVRGNLGMTPQQMLAPFCPQETVTTPDGGAADGALALNIATYNVLSLSGRAFEDRDPAGLAFSAGRPALLAASLDRADIQVAAIQEARTEAGFLRTSGFLRFASGSNVGCFGVELWFKEGFPLVRSGDAERHAATFCREAFSTAHSDSRRLILHFHSGSLKLCFASLHAPHRGTEADKLHEWWERTINLLKHAATRAPLVLGGDFNAAVGSQCCSRIGDCWPEEQDVAGAFLAELVTTCQCWLPSTWGHLHSGQSWTYVQKRNHALQRPDFVCLPDCWESARVASWVDPGIHVGQSYIDHFTAVVRVSATLRLTGGCPATSKPARIDANALVDGNNRSKLQAIVAQAPRAPWNASADAHAAQLVGYLQGALAEAFPKPQQHKRRDYLTEDTWALYAQVAALRHRCARLRAQTQYHLLAAAFRAWLTCGAEAFTDALDSPWALDAHAQGLRHRDALRGLSKQLKYACRADRARHLSNLADEVQANTPGSFRALNRLLSLKQKKPFAPEVLPEVLDADGRVCETPAEATQRWRTYFGNMESGIQKVGVMGPRLLNELSSAEPGQLWFCGNTTLLLHCHWWCNTSTLVLWSAPLFSLSCALGVPRPGQPSGKDGCVLTDAGVSL